MKINRPTWIIFFILSIFSIFFWFKFSYSQLAFTNLSINRDEALKIAEEYLIKRGVDTSKYNNAVVLDFDSSTNRYLQKSIGFKGLKKFVTNNNFDMYGWSIRFFKEKESEEYYLSISPITGKIIFFSHILDESASIEKIEKKESKELAIKFLKENYNFDPQQYIQSKDINVIRDYRSDYSFAWDRKDIQIPWTKEEKQGFGKLTTSVATSGNNIIFFSINAFKVPPQFSRNLKEKRNVGKNLLTIVRIFSIILFIGSIYFIVVRRNHLAMHRTKKFYIGVMAVSFLLSILSNLNNYEITLFNYNTTAPFNTYFINQNINLTINALFITIAILMPSLSGELLHFEVSKKKEGSFLHYILSTFLSRQVSKSVIIGYFVCIIMLGIQSILIKIGQKFWGVWVEHDLITQFSTAYIPFLTAFTIGYKASFSEELMFRLFAINWGRKLFKSIVPAVIISSLIWGFSHSGYPVFPMWFRGIEVTFLGFFLSFIYLKFGIIAVIVGHFLFDVFWSSAEHLFGVINPFYFYSSLSVLLLPLFFGLIAFAANKNVNVQPLRWILNKHQKFNLSILNYYLKNNIQSFINKNNDQIKNELSAHGWDIAVIEVALEDNQGLLERMRNLDK